MTDSGGRPIGIGIAGVGGIAAMHLASLRATTSARLAAVCDVDPVRARTVAAAEGCTAYGSVEELLDDPAVEAVIVCTPNMTHERLGLQVLAAGRHLLMEKPLALTGEGARTLQADAERRGLVLAVGHSHRFSDQGLAIRGLIDDGAVGAPRFARITMNGGWIWPGWQHWVLNPELSGGHALHNGIHLVDLASWWIGEPAVDVYARGQRVTSAALKIYDYLVIELGFASGAAAICEISRAEQPRTSSYLELVVAGPDGVISRDVDAEGVTATTGSGGTAWGVDGAGARTFARELDSFAAAARGEYAVEPPVAAAVHAVDLAVAAEESLATGRTIRIGGN